jgi:hypothetical protein
MTNKDEYIVLQTFIVPMLPRNPKKTGSNTYRNQIILSLKFLIEFGMRWYRRYP